MSDDVERLVPSEDFYYSHFPRGRGTAIQSGPHGEAPVSVRWERRVRRKPCRVFTVFCGGTARQSRESSLVMVSLKNSSRVWGTGAFPSCLVPGSGILARHGESGKGDVWGCALDGLVCT